LRDVQNAASCFVESAGHSRPILIFDMLVAPLSKLVQTRDRLPILGSPYSATSV
jgi:hypothetical protein